MIYFLMTVIVNQGHHLTQMHVVVSLKLTVVKMRHVSGMLQQALILQPTLNHIVDLKLQMIVSHLTVHQNVMLQLAVNGISQIG